MDNLEGFDVTIEFVNGDAIQGTVTDFSEETLTVVTENDEIYIVILANVLMIKVSE